MKNITAAIAKTPTKRLSLRRLTLMSSAWAATEKV